MFISDFGKSPVNLIESICEEFYAVRDQQGNPHIVGLPSGADAKAGREYLASNQYTVLTGPMESIDAVKLFFKKQLLEHAIAQIKKQLAESKQLPRYKRNRFKSLDQRRQEEEYLLRQAMLDVSNENKGSLEEIDRRGFLKGLGAAALAGATGMSVAGDLEDKIGPLPIMATIKIRLADGTVKTIKKDLGHAYDYRLDDAKKDLEDLLNRKGIKNYSIHLDRYKDNSAYLDRETNPAAADYVDRSPLKGSTSDRASDYMDNKPYKSPKGDKTYMDPAESVEEAAKKGLYYNVNKRKKAGTSRPAGHPKAPTAQAWKDAAKTAKNESVAEARDGDTNFGSTVGHGSWVVYDGSKVKRFKSREGAKAYAEKNGGKVASSEHYADKIQGKKDVSEAQQCPECGGAAYDNEMIAEEKDACYSKVKSRYKVWPSAYASGALVKCRKVGAKNWGNKSKK